MGNQSKYRRINMDVFVCCPHTYKHKAVDVCLYLHIVSACFFFSPPCCYLADRLWHTVDKYARAFHERTRSFELVPPVLYMR